MTSDTALTAGLHDPLEPDSTALAAFVARALGPSTVAVLHYGSRAQGRRPRADSAFDFFVVVDHYRPAYESLAATVGTGYAPRTAAVLAHILAPNVISVTDREGEGRRAKCCVISLADFVRACSTRRKDHFVLGRLFQLIVMAWVRDEESDRVITAAVADARASTYTWSRASLPETFTVDEFVRGALARSLAGEIRPEVGDHARTLADAQQAALRSMYAPLLQRLAHQGVLVAEGGAAADPFAIVYRQRATPSAFDRWRIRFYFQRSKMRATVRLLKHVVLYEGWLDYIVRKIERSGDTKMVLTSREQRWPLIFLWPRVFRYLRDRPQRRRSRGAE